MVKNLVQTLRNRLEEGFERECFDAMMRLLELNDNPLALNSFALCFRELIRNVLERIAPDSEVKNCSWYKEDKGNVRYPTRRQRIGYAIHGGFDGNYVESELGVDVERSISCLINHIDDLSKYCHFTKDNFGIDDKEKILAHDVLSSVNKFFYEMDICRSEVVKSVEGNVIGEVDDAFLFNVVNDLDTMATHYFVENVECEKVSLLSIKSREIEVEIYGYVDVELQYGSDADVRNDIGVRYGDVFPFRARAVGRIDDAIRIELVGEPAVIQPDLYFEDE